MENQNIAKASTRQVQEKIVAVSDIYARKFDIERDGDWYILKLHEEIGELTKVHLENTMRSRKSNIKADAKEIVENLGEEIADVYAHTLLLANHYGVDIAKEVERKWLRYLTPSET